MIQIEHSKTMQPPTMSATYQALPFLSTRLLWASTYSKQHSPPLTVAHCGRVYTQQAALPSLNTRSLWARIHTASSTSSLWACLHTASSTPLP